MRSFSLAQLKEAFKFSGTKRVSKTDISKKAYVLNQEQRELFKKIGITPGFYPDVTPVLLYMLGTSQAIEASYYGSVREGSGRDPEYRMGRFIQYLNEGEQIAFSTDGRDVFICKISGFDNEMNIREAYEESATSANEKLDLKELIRRVKKIKNKPAIHEVSTAVYYRDPAIVAFAHRRSEFKCEMPECTYEGFKKETGGLFIEAHHIRPLAEGGEDSIFNIAALCPNCHRRMHFADGRKNLFKILIRTIEEKNKKLGL